MKLKVLPVFLAFLAMGFLDAVGPFVGLAKTEFSLSNTMALLVPLVGFIMFGLVSVPMGLYQAKKGKKFVLLLGLIVQLVGTATPIFGLSSFPLFLLTVLFLGAGAATLQVAGNPMMRDVSDEGKYSRNLSLAQFVKALGMVSGAVIPPIAASWFGADWKVIFPVYSSALVVTIVSVILLKVDEKEHVDKSPVTLRSCLALLGNGRVLMMVSAIFLYVGAEVCMSSGIPLYLKSQFDVDIAKLGLLGTGLFFSTLMVGRLVGGVILNWLSPRRFFLVTVALSFVAMLTLFSGTIGVALAGVVFIGLGFANIFPLVFSITVDAMPERSDELSGLMVTAIVGGALVPPLMGLVADNSSVTAGFVVPLIAVAYIGWTALRSLKTSS